MAKLDPCRLVALSPVQRYGMITIDGVVACPGDRIVLAGQKNPAENGIYTARVNNWNFASDWNASVRSGDRIDVECGSQCGLYQATFPGKLTLGQTPAMISQVVEPPADVEIEEPKSKILVTTEDELPAAPKPVRSPELQGALDKMEAALETMTQIPVTLPEPEEIVEEPEPEPAPEPADPLPPLDVPDVIDVTEPELEEDEAQDPVEPITPMDVPDIIDVVEAEVPEVEDVAETAPEPTYRFQSEFLILEQIDGETLEETDQRLSQEYGILQVKRPLSATEEYRRRNLFEKLFVYGG